jgi:TPR repeat protein
MTDLQAGITAFADKEYTQAFVILEPLAQAGDAEAQCLIANQYHMGLGIKQNLLQAVQWYEKSASLGYAVAMNNLAGLRLTGYDNVPPNSVEAHQLFQRAMELGFEHTPSSINLNK